MLTFKWVLTNRENIVILIMEGIRVKEYRLGIEATLEILGGKWKSLIICHLMTVKGLVN